MWPFRRKPLPKTESRDAPSIYYEAWDILSPVRDSDDFLSLLNFSDPTVLKSMPGPVRAASLISQCCHSVDNPHEHICIALRQADWRPHLAAAVALAMLSYDPHATSELWAAIDRGSWVTPQLAATASQIDPMFTDHARERLRNGCVVINSESDNLPPLQHHIMTGPLGTNQRSAKAAAALVQLLRDLPQPPDWVASETTSPELIKLLVEDPDFGGQIAKEWLANLKKLLTKLNAVSPLPLS